MINELSFKNFPPTKFEIIENIPDFCLSCWFYKENPDKVIGVRLFTPYSALVMEGCISSLPCPTKTFQLAHFGFGIPFPVISTFAEVCLDALRGFPEKEIEETKKVDLQGLIETAKKICGFLDTSKRIKIILPEKIKKLFYYLLKSGLSGVFTYPLINFKIVRPIIVKGESGEIEEAFYGIISPEQDLKIDPKKILRVEIITLSGETLFLHEQIYVFHKDEFKKLPSKSAFSVPEKILKNYKNKEKELFGRLNEFSSLIDGYLKALINSSPEDEEKLKHLTENLVKLLQIKTYLTSGIISIKK